MHKNFPHTSWINSSKPTTQIFHYVHAPKIQAKIHPTISQIIYITQNSISHQHCPNYTMTKKKKKGKIQHFKNAPKPTLQHDQSYNAPNSNKITQQNDNVSPSNFQWSMKQHFSKQKKTKEKLTLISIWEYGAWVLGSWRIPSSSFHSNDGWYFLPWEVRKEGPFEESDILKQWKDGFESGFHQKWVCSKSAQEHKDLKKY